MPCDIPSARYALPPPSCEQVPRDMLYPSSARYALPFCFVNQCRLTCCTSFCDQVLHNSLYPPVPCDMLTCFTFLLRGMCCSYMFCERRPCDMRYPLFCKIYYLPCSANKCLVTCFTPMGACRATCFTIFCEHGPCDMHTLPPFCEPICFASTGLVTYILFLRFASECL